MWYHYSQNNSGGSHYGPENVYIEADSTDEADTIAENHDIYFDGCADGRDCSCCGDRWYRAQEWDAKDEPEYPIDSTAQEIAADLAGSFLGGMFRTHYRWIPKNGSVVDVKIDPETMEAAEKSNRDSRRSCYGFVFYEGWDTPGKITKVYEPQDVDYDDSYTLSNSGCATWWDESGNYGIEVYKGELGINIQKQSMTGTKALFATAETKEELEPLRSQMQKILTAARKVARKEVVKNVGKVDDEVLDLIKRTFIA